MKEKQEEISQRVSQINELVMLGYHKKLDKNEELQSPDLELIAKMIRLRMETDPESKKHWNEIIKNANLGTSPRKIAHL